MPLIVMVGPPCSGKSYWAKEVDKFISEKNHQVFLVSNNEIIKDLNQTYTDSKEEKLLRGQLKSEVVRNLNKQNVVILDALNYIKGFRYELFCAAKEQATTFCVIECSIPKDKAWSMNLKRSESIRYSENVFDGLYFRYEAPDSRNRWDSPYFLFTPESQSNFEDIYEAIFVNKPLKPNKSTLPKPTAEADFLFLLDSYTKEVIDFIAKAQKMGSSMGQLKIPDVNCCLESNRIMAPAELNRIRRLFINYVKTHPIDSVNEIKTTFVQFLNSSLA